MRVSLLSKEGGTEKTLYAMNQAYPRNQLDMRQLMAWTHAGPNPVDDSLFIIEHARPPLLGAPDSRAFEIDPLTGLDTPISDKTRDHVYFSASWSPDGRMIVLTDGNGYLTIRTILGRDLALEPSIRGAYPSWSPWGHRIYSGGYLLNLGGSEMETLLTDGFWSIAEWSPDGKKLAVVSNGDLWLFSDIMPAVISPLQDAPGQNLKEQMSLLQNLFRKGGITVKEYQERHNSLLLSAEYK